MTMADIKKHISKISALTLCILAVLFWHCAEIPNYDKWIEDTVPSKVEATANSSSRITVSWLPVPNASGYYIYQRIGSSGKFFQVGSSRLTSYADTGLAGGITYYYTVAAYNDAGATGSQSIAVSATTILTVTVQSAGIGASGGGSYAKGAKVTISAGTVAGRPFKNWTTTSAGVTFANANSSTTTFTMPGNAVTVTANFIQINNVIVSASPDASGNGSYAEGEKVTISAGTPPSNRRFKNWTTASAGVEFADANNSTTTFTMPANAVTVTANFVQIYAVTVSAGTGASGDGNYAAGDTVTIKAGTPPAGQQFRNWTTASVGVEFANVNNSTTTFIMPLGAVTVTANFIMSHVTLGSLTDSRDKQTYRTVKIGNQTWMAENLNYQTDSSRFYNNNDSNCIKYGRLYDWAAAMNLPSSCNSSSCSGQIQSRHQGACPASWHLPSRDEWSALVTAVGDSASTKLKAKSPDWDGTDEYGFSALTPFKPSNGYWYWYWWTATWDGASTAYYIFMATSVSGSYYNKSEYRSVRCVRD
jgi:uncharacterized protein (TIGR02145 family)